jgi:hypothetical protein
MEEKLGPALGEVMGGPPPEGGARQYFPIFAEPSDGLEPSTPSLPFDARGNQLQRTATDLACFSGFAAGAICRCLPLVAPAGLHKRSIPVRGTLG